MVSYIKMAVEIWIDEDEDIKDELIGVANALGSAVHFALFADPRVSDVNVKIEETEYMGDIND